jgi:hypothetical protein
MVQIRDGAGFAFEAPSGVDIGRDLWKQDLDGHPSAESNILCSVHFAHAACPEKRFQAISAEFGAGPGSRQFLSIGACWRG